MRELSPCPGLEEGADCLHAIHPFPAPGLSSALAPAPSPGHRIDFQEHMGLCSPRGKQRRWAAPALGFSRGRRSLGRRLSPDRAVGQAAWTAFLEFFHGPASPEEQLLVHQLSGLQPLALRSAPQTPAWSPSLAEWQPQHKYLCTQVKPLSGTWGHPQGSTLVSLSP